MESFICQIFKGHPNTIIAQSGKRARATKKHLPSLFYRWQSLLRGTSLIWCEMFREPRYGSCSYSSMLGTPSGYIWEVKRQFPAKRPDISRIFRSDSMAHFPETLFRLFHKTAVYPSLSPPIQFPLFQLFLSNLSIALHRYLPPDHFFSPLFLHAIQLRQMNFCLHMRQRLFPAAAWSMCVRKIFISFGHKFTANFPLITAAERWVHFPHKFNEISPRKMLYFISADNRSGWLAAGAVLWLVHIHKPWNFH